ncbi:hypothetical protein CARUB_v10013117mg [Capsella rubella]|uniref:RRM domain-containing protein n=1 Tax=Capsella rubella TaxID=81985 RepID=R0HX34_9BRAS|nr:nucleolin 2 isoform X4 [Capsella rubella]EOA30015.1 hypothetical protein CARUB_v10013117mg [Capsella rubella]
MSKSSKKSDTKVEAAPPASMTKPLKKGKRDAEQDLNIQVPKKQKKELSAAVLKEKAEKTVPKKVDSSSDSSDSSDSEEVQKTKKVTEKAPPSKLKDDSSSEEEEDNSSSEEEDDSSSDEEPAPAKKQPEPLKRDKVESSSSDDDSSSDKETAPVKKISKVESSSSEDGSSSDEEPAPATKQPEIVKKDSSSEDDSSSDEETTPVKKQPTAVMADSSSSDDGSSSDEEAAPAKKQPTVVEKPKAESGSSEDESSSDEESTPVKKQTAAVKNAKAKSSSSEEDSSSDEEPTPAKKPTVVKSAKPVAEDSTSSEEDSDDEESDDEKPPTKKAKVSPTKTSKQESSSEESDEEESEDEKVTPKKKDSDTEMVDAEQKSITKQPKTPTSQNQGGTKTLFAGNLSYGVKKADIEDFFKEAGEVVDVRIALHEDGKMKGFGHVEFASAEVARKALELNGRSLLGRDVRLDLANESARNTPRSSNPGRIAEGSQSRKLFVNGFNSSLGEDELKSAFRTLFSTCGEVARISIPVDRETGAIRGMAFIDMKSGFNEALQLGGSDIGGRNITVEEARPRVTDEGAGSYNRPEREDGGRFSNRRPGRAPGRDGRGPGRFSKPGRGPSKPSIIASSQGKKTVFNDDE